MYDKLNAILFVSQQITCDKHHIQHQFNDGLQHENPRKCFGFVRYRFHYPVMERTSCQPYKHNAYYTSGKEIGCKNRKKNNLRNRNRDSQQDGGG